MSKFEQVLTVRASSVHLSDGFTAAGSTESEKKELFNEILRPEEVVIGSRHWLENDSNFLQLIPSVVFRKPDGTVAWYNRIKGSGESRLVGNATTNFGGHINTLDLQTFDETFNLKKTIINNIYREIEEELGVNSDEITSSEFGNYFTEFKGFIFDSSNDVGLKHLGLLFVFDVEQDLEFDASIAESEGMLLKGWNTPDALLIHHELDVINLENWAKIVLEALYNF